MILVSQKLSMNYLAMKNFWDKLHGNELNSSQTIDTSIQ